MIAIYIFAALALAFILFFLVFGFIIFKRVCRRKPERPNTLEETFPKSKLSLSKERLERDFEWFNSVSSSEISIISYDKKKLYATEILTNSDSPKGVVLMFHGFRSSGIRDFCIHMRILHESGYHILLVDQRSHGRSDGKYISYGVKERKDVIYWSEMAKNRYGDTLPLCLMGLSMGGATVLMASELIEKDDGRVRAVVADCPFSLPWDIVAHVLSTRHNLLPFPLLAFVNFWCVILAHFSLRQASATAAVAVTHLPILLFHGEADDFVPTKLSFDISKAAGEKARLVTVADAAHGEAVYKNESLYTEELLAFLDQNMN